MDSIEGYCLKCKEKRPMLNPQAEWAANGSPATRGTCSVCGTNMYLRGMTAAHESLPKPEATAAPAKKTAAKTTTKKTAASKGKTAAKTPSKTAAKSSATKSVAKPAAKSAAPASNVRRSGKLVVVESPAKAKTIGKYLGKGYTVKSSVGYVRDLLKSRLSVDVENNFEPDYRVSNDKRKVVQELKEAAERASEIYLATDPDREGEAIAWHVMEAAEMEPGRTQRVVFQEITKNAILKAFENPRPIDMQRVDAQQARRILDRLVGYKLSPLLWRKVRGRLSAGRVQSVAVRLVVEREREIEAFEPVEYWTLEANLSQPSKAKVKPRPYFPAKLWRLNGEEPALHSEADVTPHLSVLERATWTVGEVKLGTRQRNPAAPFTTSTLQQEASRKLGFGTSKTMRIAQQLYEGVDIGDEGTTGLITYMRTDSVSVSQEAQAEAQRYIDQRYGREFRPDQPPIYRTKSKTAQEAHEAVRPTAVMRSPSQLRNNLSRDQIRLYELIWLRFVASQMAPAVYDTVRAEIYAGEAKVAVSKRPYHFRATGSTLRFAGFLAVYEETAPEDRPEDDQTQVPSDLTANELLDLLELLPQQHFTQPPPRFSEATLVKALEENGVGRPSTYASIIETVQHRGYVEAAEKRLVPTDTGRLVNDLLVDYFPDVLSVDFTARLEDELDAIAHGDKEWVPVIDGFYRNFVERLAVADEQLEKVDLKTEPEFVGRDCPTCEVGQLVYREGRFGRFIGCNRFPTCRHTEQILVRTGVTCARGGEIIEKKTRKGKTFYGCVRYPECSFTSWKPPVSADEQGIWVQVNKATTECVACGFGVEPKVEEKKGKGKSKK